MLSRTIHTDYLVVGAGTAGMAFTDALITGSDRTALIVDRRDAPGGHWRDAYSFVRLHHPSAYYGVGSSSLGQDSIDLVGNNQGCYETATAAEICAYYDRVLEGLVASGRVQSLLLSEYEASPDGNHYVVSRLTGERRRVVVGRKLVDATYLQTSVPSTHVRSFEVGTGVRCVPINDLARMEAQSGRYVVLGAGKTAIDACLFLLENGIAPSRIRWVKPREAWLLDRVYSQPLALLGTMLEAFARQCEAAAAADSVEDLFRRLEASGQLLRVDTRVTPTMYRCATVNARELYALRRIEDVVRLGRVTRIEPQRITLQRGSVDAYPDDLYVDCTATGFKERPGRPIFEADRITLQPVRTCQPSFNSALLGHIEATRDDLAQMNRLCPPNPYPVRPEDWMRMFVVSNVAQGLWAQDAELAQWLDGFRLNASRGSRARSQEPAIRARRQRIKHSIVPAIQNLMRLQARGAAMVA